MKNLQEMHRGIATFFLLIFFPTILLVNMLYASNNTPGAPEAASFEPIDAKDMSLINWGLQLCTSVS
jgi:hypothetical protein